MLRGRQHQNWAWGIIGRAAPYRGRIQLVADALAWLVAIYVATGLRFDFDFGQWSHTDLWIAFAIAALAQVGTGSVAGLYRERWRFGSFEEVAALVASIAAATGVLLVTSRTVFSPRLVPNSIVVDATPDSTRYLSAASSGGCPSSG